MRLKVWLVFIYMMVFLVLMSQSVLFLNLLGNESMNYYLYQIGLYSITILLVFVNWRRISGVPILKIAFAYFIMAFLFSVLRMDSFSIRSFFAIVFNTASMPLALCMGVLFSQEIKEKWNDLILVFSQIPAFVSGYYLLTFPYGVNPDAVFAIFVFAPLCFLIRRKWLSYFILFLYLLVVLLTAKRSVFVSVALSISLYLIYNLYWDNNRKFFQTLFIIGLGIIAGYYYLVHNSDLVVGAVERFETLESDVYNGRDDIFSLYVSHMSNSDFFDYILGHGYTAVRNDVGKGAHNDILEILYDYGILVLLIFIIFFVKIFHTLFRSMKDPRYRTPAFYAIIICLIIAMLGMFNCILASNLYVYALYTSLGIAIGFVNRTTDYQNKTL